MNEQILLAITAAISAAVGALIMQAASSRRAPAQARLDDANAERVQHESVALVNTQLRAEIERLSAKVFALEIRVVDSERRSMSAEMRLSDTEYRSNEFRRAVIAVGEKLTEERDLNLATTEKLVILIEHLRLCIESPDKAAEIDWPGVDAMIANIRNRLPRR